MGQNQVSTVVHGGLASSGDGGRGSGPGSDCVDLGDALAAFSEAGFTGVEREGIWDRVFERDASALGFDPV